MLMQCSQLHPLCQQKEIVAYCKERGIIVQAYCPILRGDFSGPILQEVVKSVSVFPLSSFPCLTFGLSQVGHLRRYSSVGRFRKGS